MPTLYTYLFLTICSLVIPLFCGAQKNDTLETVLVQSNKGKNRTASPVPIQILDKEDISLRNSLTVADAVKYFAGITVKDYGGLGGLKTVSVRSLGANHTGVIYDGLILGDAQGGQTDLGKFPIDNIQEIQFNNSGPAKILSPARAFAFSSLLSLITTSEHVKKEEGITFNLKKGSFGYISPAMAFRTSVGDKFQTGFNAFFQSAKGDYGYRSYENGRDAEKRINADARSYRLEYDASYALNDSNNIRFKAYYYNSDRGLPGAVILYSHPGYQRLKDDNLFFQTSWQNRVIRRSSFLVSAKFSRDNSYYTDPSYPNNYGRLENNFHQQEFYLSGVYKFNLIKTIALSYATDVFYSTLKRTDIFAQNFADPERNTLLHNIAFQFKKDNAEVIGNVLYTDIREKVSRGKAGKNFNEFSPAISASVQPFLNLPLRLRGFFKHIFRAPTFNDLYYTNIGNIDLRPEYADQFNFGITVKSGSFFFVENCFLTVDSYINYVKNKILAVPRQNLFQWSMQNIGEARITGTDAALHLKFADLSGVSLSSNITYGFQNASDRSDINSSLYKTQLPYTPKHCGSLNINAKYKKAVVGYNLLMSSDRYRAGDPIPENIVESSIINDVTLSYSFGERSAEYRIIAEANNIFNTQYEVIKYYPMPRFNYRIGLTVFLKNKQLNKNIQP